MTISVQRQIGKSLLTFNVEAETEIEALAQASFYTTTPEKCGRCESGNIVLDANRAKGFTFIKIRCLDCRAACNVGQLKAGGLFWKKFEEYVPRATTPAVVENETNETKEPTDEGDVEDDEDFGGVPF